jgi:O-antigen/teichoic acid export membrane protein
MTTAQVIVRNAAYLLSGNLATWGFSLLVWLVVPRVIGPAAWGEFNLGLAVSSLAVAVGGFGIATYLLKEIARDRDRSGDALAAGLAASAVLAVPIAAAVVAFTWVAGYTPHTRTVVLLVTCVSLANFLVAPAVSALQALEKMHVNTLVNGARTVVSSATIVALAAILRPGIIALIVAVLIITVLGSVVQLVVTNRDVPVRLKLDRRLAWRMITGGLPFWSNGVFLTIYIWLDSILLSLMASNREVGYYAAPVQVIVTLGFVPALVSTVIFPSLARDFRADLERARRLSRASLSGLITLGLPISVGIALVGPSVIRYAFGPAFAPSAPVMVVLALTIVPGYVATLAYWILAAADRQRLWAYVMGFVAIGNPLINLGTITYFQQRTGHGSMGAAVALLVTDVVVAVAGLALMPRGCLTPVRPLLSAAARAGLATAAMAIPVWFLRDSFLALPVIVGVCVFIPAALALGVFRGDGYTEVRSALTARLLRRLNRRTPIDVPA